MADSSLHIETGRLLLRPPVLADLVPWAAMMQDAEAAKFIGGVQPRATCWRSLMTMIGAWQAMGFAMFSVFEKRTGEWIGRLGPWQPDGWPGTEVGWGLRRESWGQGFALEGAIATIDWAFAHLGWSEVVHTIAPENTPSIRLAQRLGSLNRGPVQLPAPHAELRVDLWAQTRAQWLARRAAGLPPCTSTSTGNRGQQ
jgi:RimJ/RimL family protein N-acetyltransferase